MLIKFILQIMDYFRNGDYDNTDVEIIYDYLRKLDYETLISLRNTNSVVSYNNDLEICIEIMDKITYILIEYEEYEKCQKIKDKKDLALELINKNIINYEYTTNLRRRKEKNSFKTSRT